MNTFNCGDEVRFIDNELNQSELGNNVNKPVFIVVGSSPTAIRIHNIGVGFQWFHYSRFELARPKEGSCEWAIEQMRAGKMVIRDGSVHPYYFQNGMAMRVNIYDSIDQKTPLCTSSEFLWAFKCYSGWKVYDPSQVKVNISLEGTILPYNKPKSSRDDLFWLVRDNGNRKLLSLSWISPADVKKVKMILAAFEQQPSRNT